MRRHGPAHRQAAGARVRPAALNAEPAFIAVGTRPLRRAGVNGDKVRVTLTAGGSTLAGEGMPLRIEPAAIARVRCGASPRPSHPRAASRASNAASPHSVPCSCLYSPAFRRSSIARPPGRSRGAVTIRTGWAALYCSGRSRSSSSAITAPVCGLARSAISRNSTASFPARTSACDVRPRTHRRDGNDDAPATRYISVNIHKSEDGTRSGT